MAELKFLVFDVSLVTTDHHGRMVAVRDCDGRPLYVGAGPSDNPTFNELRVLFDSLRHAAVPCDLEPLPVGYYDPVGQQTQVFLNGEHVVFHKLLVLDRHGTVLSVGELGEPVEPEMSARRGLAAHGVF